MFFTIGIPSDDSPSEPEKLYVALFRGLEIGSAKFAAGITPRPEPKPWSSALYGVSRSLHRRIAKCFQCYFFGGVRTDSTRCYVKRSKVAISTFDSYRYRIVRKVDVSKRNLDVIFAETERAVGCHDVSFFLRN
ncbi:MAG TPA: hypothetical protein VGM92_14185 [Candidatus Kapabacteria bacterium]